MVDIETAVAVVQRLKGEVTSNYRSVENAKSALSKSEVALSNAQNELGKLLDQAGVVGSDFRLVSKQKASDPVLAEVFGVRRVG